MNYLLFCFIYEGVYRCEVRNIYGWYWRESKMAAMGKLTENLFSIS